MNAPYAIPSDYEVCRRIHRQYGTTYYFATRRFQKEDADKVHALYAFVRVPDEWVDNPGGRTPEEVRALLKDWRAEFHAGLQGTRPNSPELRAFCDVVRSCGIPQAEADCFLDAMEMDLTVDRYPTYPDLCRYMRGSAAAVGIMMCYALRAEIDDDLLARATELGEAMQLANFIRDVGEDRLRGRIYLPLEDLARFGVTEGDILAGRLTPQFIELLKFQIARARALFQASEAGIARLPASARLPVLLARKLYAQILDKVEGNGYDVFNFRARTSTAAKIGCAVTTLLQLRAGLGLRAGATPDRGKGFQLPAWYWAIRRFTQNLF